MTDNQALFEYRIKQADETIAEAGKMLDEGFSPRTVINRAYYSIFYALLALFNKEGVNPKTSKHSGIIAIFDREFVHPGKIGTEHSKSLHKIFNLRQTGDYQDFSSPSKDEAGQAVKDANSIIKAIKQLIEK